MVLSVAVVLLQSLLLMAVVEEKDDGAVGNSGVTAVAVVQ